MFGNTCSGLGTAYIINFINHYNYFNCFHCYPLLIIKKLCMLSFHFKLFRLCYFPIFISFVFGYKILKYRYFVVYKSHFIICHTPEVGKLFRLTDRMNTALYEPHIKKSKMFMIKMLTHTIHFINEKTFT